MQESNSRFGNLSAGLLSFGGTVLLTSFIVAAATVGLRELGILQGLELNAYDLLMRSRPDPGPDKRFLIVGINDEDIQKRKESPIHDGTLAQTLGKLEEKGARIIGVDILRDVPQGSATGREELTKRLSQSDRIIAVCELSKPNAPGTPTAPGITDDRVGVADYQPDPGGIVRRGMLIATPAKPDKEPSVKHICNQIDAQNQLPSLSFQMVLGYLAEVELSGKNAPHPSKQEKTTQSQATPNKNPTDQKVENKTEKDEDADVEDEDAQDTDSNSPTTQETTSGIQPETTKSGEIKLGDIVLKRLQKKAGGYRHLDDGAYQILLNYRSANNAFKVVSLSDVLADKVPEADIKDKVVLVGYTAAVVHDTFYTPFSAGATDNQKMPGVIVHAQNASQIISAVLDKKPLIWYWQDWQENTWIFGWTVLGAILAWRIRTPWLLLLGSGVAMAILGGTVYYLFLQAGWIPLVPPLFGLLLSTICVVLIKMSSNIQSEKLN